MKILTVFTGGTIGSIQGNDGIRRLNSMLTVNENVRLTANDYDLIKTFIKNNNDYCVEEFEAISPVNTLSENMSLAKLSEVINAIDGKNLNDYDGVIITHGTDTLAYSAAVIAQMTAGYNIPIVLVSSNHPLNDERANGHVNFSSAVKLIEAKVWKGTFVTYSYDLITAQVYLGSRIVQSQAFSDNYTSIGGSDFVSIGEEGIIVEDSASSERLFSSEDEPTKTNSIVARLNANVLIISPYVGINYNNYNLEGVDGIIHTLYHSFTYPNEGNGDNSLLALADKCRHSNVKFVIAPIDYIDQSYEGSEAIDIAIKCPRQSLETVYAKMVIAISQGMNSEKIAEYMASNVAQEIF